MIQPQTLFVDVAQVLWGVGPSDMSAPSALISEVGGSVAVKCDCLCRARDFAISLTVA